MERAGLISRTRDAKDERRVLIELTAKGRNLRADAGKVPATLSANLAIDEESIVNLREQVRALIAVLQRKGSQDRSEG